MASAPATVSRPRISRRRQRARRAGGRAALYVIAWVAAIATLVPILYAILGGFRDTGQLSTTPVGWPDPWVFSNYTGILKSGTFWHQVWNSVLIALVSTALTVPVAARGVHLRPLHVPRARGALHDLHPRAAVPGRDRDPPDLHHGPQPRPARQPAGRRVAAGGLRASGDDHHPAPFFHSIPSDLQDAAAIDGCGPFRFFWRILIPLSRPVLATVSVLAIVGSWNAFLLPLVVLTDSGGWTLPLGVTNYSQQYTTDTAKVLAFTTLSMVPALIFYAFAERQLIKGLTSGAVKG